MDPTIESVHQMQEYIKEHLDQEITMGDLAQAAMYSPWHAYRLFVRHVGISPSRYIRKCRLAKSAMLLRDTGISVTRVAFNLGFGSVDGYQRAFLREFGCNPGEYAARPQPIPLFFPYDIKYRQFFERSNDMQHTQTVFLREMDKPQRQMIIRRSASADNYWDYCNQVGCDVWGVLLSIPNALGAPMGAWLPPSLRLHATGSYVQGVEVPMNYDPLLVPQGYELMELPAQKFLEFHGQPFAEEEYCQAIEQVQEAIEEYDPSIIGLQYDPNGLRLQMEPVGATGYIELIGVV